MNEFTVKQVMDAVELWEGRATLGVARPLFFRAATVLQRAHYTGAHRMATVTLRPCRRGE